VRSLLRSTLCVALCAGAGGCAVTAPPDQAIPMQSPAGVAACRALFGAVDARVAEAGVGDAQYSRVEGYPYLRMDRFLDDPSVRPGPEDEGFGAWVEAMRARDDDARRVELANLPAPARGALGEDVGVRLDACAGVLTGAELEEAEDRRRLLSVARVPDDYSVSLRVIGLYPFTSLPFKAGVEDLHESMLAEFARPLDALPVVGRLQRYVPPPPDKTLPAASVRELLRGAPRDAHGVPVLSAGEVTALFATFAPTYEIDVATDDDRIGAPYWSEDGLPSVDVRRPVVFRRVSFARLGGETLLQLNYLVWFPSRPPDGDFDLLSGRLDGITFRVTLDGDGRPLLYDSMHNCGCYHLFLPTTRLALRPPSEAHEEAPLVPQRIEPRVGRPVLRIAHGTHYLQRLYFEDSAEAGSTYAFREDDTLRSLPLAEGERRSLFGPDGIVPGSERGERWLFWPMGVVEPGAMRQWGRHATAFVGTRHFDDPDLIERYFVLVE
jgi:hypothetical protein